MTELITITNSSITAEMILAGVRSFCLGRLRLRLQILRGLDAGAIETLCGMLRQREGVTDVVVNPRVGSLLLTWDPNGISMDPGQLAQEAADLFEAAKNFGFFAKAECPDESRDVGSGLRCVGSLPEEKFELTTQGTCGCGNRHEGELRHLTPSAAALVKNAAESADGVLALLSGFAAPDVKKGARAKRVTQNRLMLLMLAASLGALACGKTSHTVLGAGFLGFLGVHLWQHCRVL